MSIEVQLLGELMADSAAFDTYLDIASAVDDTVFLDARNQHIYRAIKTIYLAGGKADSVTVAASLDAEGKLDAAGGLKYIGTIESGTISGAYIRNTTKMVIDAYFKDRLRRLGDRLSKETQNGKPTDEIAEKMIAEMQRVLERGELDNSVTARQAVKMVVDEYDGMRSGNDVRYVPSGIASLDEKLSGGFRDANLIIVGARPSTGKSNVAFNFMINMTAQGFSVGLISAEMDTVSVMQRSLACVGGFDDIRLATGNLSQHDDARFRDACGQMEMRKVVINDNPSPTIAQVEVLAKKWKREHKIDVLIIDYLQYLKPSKITKGMTREQEVAQVSNTLKRISRQLQIPVIVMAQLNRAHEHANQTPKLSDIRESGAAEQDADVVILLHSFEAVNQMTIPDKFGPMAGQPSKDVVLFLIEKQRRGVRKVAVFVRFDKTTGRMTSIDTRNTLVPDSQEYYGPDTTGEPF